MLVDSFRPRNIAEVCNHGMLVSPQLQAQDAFNAADYLRSRGDVRVDRVAVIGFSHGGWAVLKAVLAGVARQPRTRPFTAAVAFYPGCDPPTSFSPAIMWAVIPPPQPTPRLKPGRSWTRI